MEKREKVGETRQEKSAILIDYYTGARIMCKYHCPFPVLELELSTTNHMGEFTLYVLPRRVLQVPTDCPDLQVHCKGCAFVPASLLVVNTYLSMDVG